VPALRSRRCSAFTASEKPRAWSYSRPASRGGAPPERLHVTVFPDAGGKVTFIAHATHMSRRRPKIVRPGILSLGHGWGHGSGGGSDLGFLQLHWAQGETALPSNRPALPSATMTRMSSQPKRVTISGPGLAGSYEVVEQRSDGSLLLRPEPEPLSKVLRETDGAVFRDEEFIAHLERVMATEDDLPGDRSD